MKFSVNPKIFEKFSGVEIGVLVIIGMDNRGSNQEILQLLRSEESRQKELLTGVELGSLSEISIWRKIYKDFGSNHKDYRSSVESLLRRARGGEKPIPSINNLVDLYNYFSIKYHLPAGAEDLDKVIGDIELAFAQGSEKGKYIGGEEEDTCYQDEVIYKDNDGFICRRWNWREGDRTKIEKESKNAVLVIEKAPGVNDDNFKQALEEGAETIRKYLKGQVQTFILNQASPSSEVDFKTGGKAKITRKPSATTVSKSSNKPQKHVKEKSLSLLDSFFEDKDLLVYKLKEIIYQVAKESLNNTRIRLEDIKIEHPANENYGDYSTNLALVLAGRLKMKPIEIANLLGNKLSEYIRIHQTISDLPDSKHPSEEKLTVSAILENVTVEQPGFVNLMLRTDYLINQAHEVLKEENAVISTSLRGRRIAVEYTDPNPFKEFHIGHLYSNVIGEAISRLFEACGATVWRGDFYGDVGMHIAKSLYGLLAKLKTQNSKLKTLQGEDYIKELERELDKLESMSIKERQNFLGQGYALGVNMYEEDKEIAEEIKDINYLIYMAGQEVLKKKKGWQPIINYRQYIKGKEEKLPEVAQVYEAGLRWSLEYFETIYKRLGTKFDGYYPESWVGEYGMKMVEKGLKMGVLEKSDGSVIYKGEKDGLHTRVFVNKLGLPTYEAKDLGLAFAKYQDFKYDLSINVFGREIDEYYKVVKAAMKKIEPTLGEKAYHIAHGMVKLPQGKMSSRTGTVVTFAWLLAEAKKYALEIMEKSRKDTPGVARKDSPGVEESVDSGGGIRESESIAEEVALGAIRYALLKNSPENDVVFDFDKSVSFEGDSGPYLQYTYTRCKSVLRKAEGRKDTWKVAGTDSFQVGESERFKSPALPAGRLKSPKEINTEEKALLRCLYRFPEVVSEAARTLSPNLVCAFLYELAQKYNLFYQKHSILSPKDIAKVGREGLKDTPGATGTGSPGVEVSAKDSIIRFRLFLTHATATSLQKGLSILGIKTVERM